MIAVQDVVTLLKVRLDAEGSDRYLFDNDFKPNINSSVDYIVSVFNSAFSRKKISEESLRDLVKTRIWQASSLSRISIKDADIGHKMWTILGVFPEPTVVPATPPPALADPLKSVFVGNVSYVSSDHSADKLTIEQWNKNKKNVFMAGNEVLTGALIDYAYQNFNDYSSTSYTDTLEIEIRPEVAAKFVAIAYLKAPNKITAIGDDIELPETLLEMIVNKALNFMAYKQGDGTNLYAVSNQDVSTLISLMI